MAQLENGFIRKSRHCTTSNDQNTRQEGDDRALRFCIQCAAAVVQRAMISRNMPDPNVSPQRRTFMPSRQEIAVSAGTKLAAANVKAVKGVVGFDGFVDSIIDVVDKRHSATSYDRLLTL